MEEINNIRAMFNKIRTFFSNIIQSIFGVFLNLVIEFQVITISIKDLIGKTIGIMTSLLYVLDGSILTMQSTWNGPPGQMVRRLGKCFHPNTYIQLLDGNIKCVKELHLGDVLKDGSIINAVMQIDNKREPEKIYEIPKGGVNGAPIYVTGSHLVWDKKTDTFIPVCYYSEARLSTNANAHTDILYCFITSNHKIQIGREIFWDWEDHFIR